VGSEPASTSLLLHTTVDHDTNSDPASIREALARRVDAIESAYEMMLAYAAQGLPSDQHSTSGGQLRDHLSRFYDALTGFSELYRTLLRVEGRDEQAFEDFLAVLAADAKAAQAGIRLVTSKPSISSQLIDNLNASIHVRALLTDVFLIDEALK
jgi:hypothetical protein